MADDGAPAPGALQTGEVVARIRSASLVPSERRVMDIVVARPRQALESSVTQLADTAGTSASTVVRACKKIGFQGFHDLKLRLASDLALHEQQRLANDLELDDEADPRRLVSRVLHHSATALANAASTVDTDAFATVVERLSAARRILVVGNGTSSSPAQDAAYRFCALGLDARAPQDAIAQSLGARQLTADDVCLVVSHTGATRDSLIPAEAAHDGGAHVAAITSFARSPLTELAESTLVAGGHEVGFRLESMSSRLAHLAIVDALFVGVALADSQRSMRNLDLMASVTAQHSF